jgi:hypothetical protein
VARATAGVLAIDATTGNRTLLHEPAFGTGPPDTPQGVAASPLGTAVYFVNDLIGSPALVALDLATATRSIVADAAHGSGATLDDGMRVSASVDGLQAFLGDGARVLAVNLATGDRTVISDAATGSGPALSSVRDLAVGAQAQTLFVTDDAAGLLHVDTVTGDRTPLAPLAVLGGSVSGALLAFDPTRGLAYLSNDDGGDLVYRVDVTVPGVASTLSAVGPGSAAAFDHDLDGCAFDIVRDRLFVQLEGYQYLARVNPQADTAVVVSDALFDTGPVMRHGSIDAAPFHGVLYVGVAGGLLAVDTESGHRVLVALVGNRTRPDL